MLSKRLNIMLYSDATGEQMVLPINPASVDIKYEKTIETYDIIGFGQVNIPSSSKPLSVKLAHFLPEDDSVFKTNSVILRQSSENMNIFTEYEYSSSDAVSMLKNWAIGKYRIRMIIDDVLNIECIVVSFTETLRESTASKPYILETVEYKTPTVRSTNSYGLMKRTDSLSVPSAVLMKKNDTLYSIASKYGLNYKILAKNNGIMDVNASYEGKKILTQGA